MILGMNDVVQYLREHIEYLSDFIEAQIGRYEEIDNINQATLNGTRIDIWYDISDYPIGHITFDLQNVGDLYKIDEIGKQNRVKKYQEEIHNLEEQIKALKKKINDNT